MTAPFSLKRVHVEDVPVIRLGGELDLQTAPELGEVLAELCAENRSVVLDMADLTFIDSSGLGVLVRAHKRLTARGSQIVLAGVQRRPELVIKMTKLDFFIPICSTEAEAVAVVLAEGAA